MKRKEIKERRKGKKERTEERKGRKRIKGGRIRNFMKERAIRRREGGVGW